jgi:hypothetical protein
MIIEIRCPHGLSIQETQNDVEEQSEEQTQQHGGGQRDKATHSTKFKLEVTG